MARRILCLALVFSLMFAISDPLPRALACGPSFTEAIFTHSVHPDFPLAEFAKGNLGVLQPTYARSYLVVAYRYLSGKTLSSSEQQSVVALWNRRLAVSYFDRNPDEDPSAQWILARHKYTKGQDPDYIDRFRKQWGGTSTPGWDFFYFENCLEDSFRTAIRTLKQRAVQFGPSSDALRSWIATQDIVFSYCGGAGMAHETNPPPPLPSSAPALLRADRQYQLASIQFYSGNFTTAESEFSAIAADGQSPWHTLAPLLAARSLIRNATLKDTEKDGADDLRAADEQLQQILRDPKQRATHAAANRLRGFIAYRLRPEQRYAELAEQLSNRPHMENLGDAIGDYTIFLDKGLGDTPDMDSDERSKTYAAGFAKLKSQRKQTDLTDWLITFQSTNSETAAHAFNRWKETRSLPWLIVAISKARGATPESAALIDASAAFDVSSPAYAEVLFHRNRLLAEASREDEARINLDVVLGNHETALPRSTVNLLLALRLKLARNLDEWLANATRVPTLVTTDDQDDETPIDISFGDDWPPALRALWADRLSGRPRFDADAAISLTEKFPLGLQVSAANNPILPEPLRRNIAQAAWVRAILLDRRDTALTLAPKMKSLFPERAPDINAYEAAVSEEESRFAGSLSILKSPGWHPYVETGAGRETLDYSKIDDYKDNWWCSGKSSSDTDWSYYDYYQMWARLSAPMAVLYPDGTIGSPEFLDEASRKQAAVEWTALLATGAAVEALGKPVLAWATSHPEDPRVPEALHYLARADRYGCPQPTRVNYSKVAFTLLHKRYPKSEWTKKTPYWF
jgi:hypothetical protein